MKAFLSVCVLLSALLTALFWQTAANLDWCKDHAEEVFTQNGFKIVGYQGYNLGSAVPGYFHSSWGGAKVWYTLERIPANGVTYEACVQRWGDEGHIYALRAIDAIKP